MDRFGSNYILNCITKIMLFILTLYCFLGIGIAWFAGAWVGKGINMASVMFQCLLFLPHKIPMSHWIFASNYAILNKVGTATCGGHGVRAGAMPENMQKSCQPAKKQADSFAFWHPREDLNFRPFA